MLSSAEFGATDRLKNILRFVVEEALAGRSERLKGYTIAVEVLGHDPASFDPQSDPVVRMEAGKLRRRLDLCYRGGGGADPVRILSAAHPVQCVGHGEQPTGDPTIGLLARQPTQLLGRDVLSHRQSCTHGVAPLHQLAALQNHMSAEFHN